MAQMQVARLLAPGGPLEVGLADKPVPGPHDVLVQVAACGVVPNTHNLITSTDAGPALPALPAVFGLDVSGTVESVGAQVLGLEVGQRVYVDPHLTCQTCLNCRRGRGDLCPWSALRGYLALGERAREVMEQYPIGGLAEYVVAPARTIARIPESVDLFTAARLGYIGTSYAALRRGALGPGGTVLINGATGTLGVAAVAIALGWGASCVLGVGRDQELLAQVRTLAPGRVKTASSEDGTDLVAWAHEHTGGRGVDVLYDCLGVGADTTSTNTLVAAVRAGGCAVLAGGGDGGDITQSYPQIMHGDVAVHGSAWFTSADIDECIAMIGSGAVDLSFLQHREFPLAAVEDALSVVGNHPGGFTNVVVVPGNHDA